MKNYILKFLFLVLIPFAFVPTVYAQVACQSVFETQQYLSRQEITDFVRIKGLPAVEVQLDNGSLPVILINSQTAPMLLEVLRSSIGTMVSHQKGYNNDHGLIRIKGTIADMDRPGSRARGEFHQTGISWVPLAGYLKAGGRYNRVEVLYSLSPAEMRTTELYARMRRAAIVRAKFTFGSPGVNSKANNQLEAGENCFGFCAAGSIHQQLREIQVRFENVGLGSLESVTQKPDVQAWTQQVYQRLMQGDGNSEILLSPRLPYETGVPDSIATDKTFQALTENEKIEALNWIVGGALTKDYLQLTDSLGFSKTGNGFSGMKNSRASAVLIYDLNTSSADFLQGHYESVGVFSTWRHDSFKFKLITPDQAVAPAKISLIEKLKRLFGSPFFEAGF